MTISIHVLLLEHSSLEAEFLVGELRRAGFVPEWRRVDTEEKFLRSLAEPLDVILADYNLPHFDGLRALRHLQRLELDVPLILVTGSFEDLALQWVREGAADYVIKGHLARLGPAVTRAIEQRRLRAEKRLADAALHEQDGRFRALVQHGPDVVAILRLDGRLIYVSPSVRRVLGREPARLIDSDFFASLHPDDSSHVRAVLTALLSQPGETKTVEFRQRHSDGSWRHLEAVATNLSHIAGVQGVVLNARDITERRLLQEQLAQRALYDPLTGLPNRALFADRVAQTLAAKRGGAVAVLLIDLDDFKRINYSLGHDFGDEVLAAVARRLETCVGAGDTVARMGADEFAIVIPKPGRVSALTRLAQRVLGALQQPFVLHNQEIHAPASIGIALSADAKRMAPSDLLNDAELALYQAKVSGRACFRVFDESVHRQAIERLSLEADLRHAIEWGELRLYCQPIVKLSNREITGVEALVRWQHPWLGLLAPAQFLPLAEETGLILEIDDWVLQETCRAAKAWLASGSMDGQAPFSVNVSVWQLQRPDLIDRVQRALVDAALQPSSLRLEITEGSLMQDVDAAMQTLSRLKQLGVGLAIDDFGTGYSSLSYVQRFPLDTIKIDRSFVAEIGRKPATEAILQAIVALARALNCRTIAEGIEADEQLAFLRRIGCNEGQGYLFSRPVPEGEFVDLMVAQPAVS